MRGRKGERERESLTNQHQAFWFGLYKFPQWSTRDYRAHSLIRDTFLRRYRQPHARRKSATIKFQCSRVHSSIWWIRRKWLLINFSYKNEQFSLLEDIFVQHICQYIDIAMDERCWCFGFWQYEIDYRLQCCVFATIFIRRSLYVNMRVPKYVQYDIYNIHTIHQSPFLRFFACAIFT